jgi:hypothetical protein
VQLENDEGSGGGAGRARVVLMGHSCVDFTLLGTSEGLMRWMR